jgi:hypothetical protein
VGQNFHPKHGREREQEQEQEHVQEQEQEQEQELWKELQPLWYWGQK